MRSFAAIAGFVAAANALAVSSAAPYATPTPIRYEGDTPIYETDVNAYPSSTSAKEEEYPASSSVNQYPASSAPGYAASSSAPGYAASSSSAGYNAYPASSSAGYDAYPVSSSAAYPSYATSVPSYDDKTKTPIGYSTTVISKYETDCPEPTTLTWNSKTYTITKSTKLVIEEPCTTTVPVYATPVVSKPSSAPVSGKPVAPASSGPAVPYYPISSNGTVAKPPAATGGIYPTTTKPTLPESTGAAAQMGVGMLAVIGAVAAFL